MNTKAMLLAFAIAVPLYVLSSGPAWRYSQGGTVHPAILDFYNPLAWLCDEFWPIGGAMQWYVCLWYDPDGPPCGP
jgi:hypothetical protein